MNKKENKEELIGEDFDFFETKFIEVTWSDYLASEPKLFDCSFDDAMSGLDVYALCLNLGFMPDEKSLLFYNNYSNLTKSLEGDYDWRYGDMPDFDQCFILNPQNFDKEFDEILFIIGRPKTKNSTSKAWIDSNQIKDVIEEICLVDCKIRAKNGIDYLMIRNIKYEYNKYGAMVLFGVKKIDDSWIIDLSHYQYLNGLSDIIERHFKTATNSV